jgi:type IV secretion system protein VirB8
MNRQSRVALEAYYLEADSWGKDRQDAIRTSRRLAWIIAGAAVAIAVLLAITLVVLMPLKTVQPYTLLVDRTTGYVQELNPIDPQRISGDTALTQSFLVQYVIARESFDIDTIQADYRKVALWSADQARTDYVGATQSSNALSPLNVYPRTTVVETRVKSVSPLGPDTALVRFETQRRDAGGQLQPPHPWVAVVRYRYSGEPMTAEDRFVNPLGFQVVRYRRDAEALPPEPAPAPAQQAAPPAVVKVPAAAVQVVPRNVQPQRPRAPEPEL